MHQQTDELVDVGSVPRGNKCGCICPSCKTPLTARQGEQNEWHFAHQSRGVHKETKRECEYSFVVSVRLMIRQLAGDGLKILVPELVDHIDAYSEVSYQHKREDFCVAKKSLIELDSPKVGAVFSGVEVDVIGFVKKFQFVIYITYKGRHIPMELLKPDTEQAGIIEINLESLLPAFQQEKKGQYINVLKEFIEEKLNGKSWVYHPRTKKKRKEAQNRIAEWLSQQKPPKSTLQFEQPRKWNVPRTSQFSRNTPKLPAKRIIAAPMPVHNFECMMCGTIWRSTSNHCKKCNTHLYTVSKDIGASET